MQVIFINEDEGRYSIRTNSMDFVIHTRRVNKYMKGEHTGGFGRRFTRIQDSGGIFSKY